MQTWWRVRFRFFDIDGRTVEISSDVDPRQHRKIEPKESIPVRLSHVVINSPQPEQTVGFYQRFLDFSLSDTLMSPHMGEVMVPTLQHVAPQHRDRPMPARVTAPRLI